MDRVKRKIFSELFFAPSVAGPIATGVAAAAAGWLLGGSSLLTAAAWIGILGGLGWMFVRTFLRVETITDEALRVERQEQEARHQRQLDQLAAQLRTDRDQRTQDYLTLLRSVREDFEAAANRAGSRVRSAQVRDKIGQVTSVAVDQLRQSFRLWERSENLVGEARQALLQEREQLIREIGETTERLQATVRQFCGLVESEDTMELDTLHEQLEATMRIASRTEERMREIENPSAAHESFLRE